MRNGSPERAGEEDSRDANPLGQVNQGVTVRRPAEMRFLSDEEHQVGFFVPVKSVLRHVDAQDQAIDDLNIRPEHCGRVHRAGKVEDVKRLGVEFRKRLRIEQMDDAIDRASRDLTPVHPPGKRHQQSGVFELRLLVKLNQILWLVFHCAVVEFSLECAFEFAFWPLRRALSRKRQAFRRRGCGG